MNCDQIIYLGIFAIIAVYLYQNVLTPNKVDYFTLGGFGPSESAHAANAANTPSKDITIAAGAAEMFL